MSRFDDVFARVCSFTDYEKMSRPAQARFERTLDGVRGLASRLDDPHLAYQTIHVAGTKGKGSTSELLAAVLGSHGLRVGLYTSPHLISITERIRVDGAPIDEDELADVLETVLDRGGIDGSAGAGPEPATFFDIMTVAAFEYFRRCRVDWAVIEAGLGGRLDSTNIVRPAAGLITSISLDHTASLGNDVESIAREKAGIIKPGMVVACDVSTSHGVATVVRDACAQAALSPIELGEPGCEIHAPNGEPGFDVDLGQRQWRQLELGTPGVHQRRNAALALAVLDRLSRGGKLPPLDEECVRDALRNVRIAGRGERIGQSPEVVLDGAHNPASAMALRTMLDHEFGSAPRHLVISIASDKDWRGFLDALLRPEDTVYATRTANPRVLDPSTLAEAAGNVGATSVLTASSDEAMRLARQNASPAQAGEDRAQQGPICVTGSLYLVGEVREQLLAAGGSCCVGRASAKGRASANGSG